MTGSKYDADGNRKRVPEYNPDGTYNYDYDKPNWMFWVFGVAPCVLIFGGSAIGFLIWILNGQK